VGSARPACREEAVLAPGHEGDLKSEFEKVALPQLDSLYNLAFRMSRNEKDAEDLVQETYLRAFRFFDRYEPGTNIKAWLFRILKNSFINRYRSRQRDPETVDFGKIEESYETVLDDGYRRASRNPEEFLVDSLVGEEVERAFSTLPTEYREVVVLALMEEMSYKEIARALEIPIGTVMSRLHRGRRILQKKLAEHALASPGSPGGGAPSGENTRAGVDPSGKTRERI
jgi:RNA polymerase sigma-70 factor (ECF subfamily)